MAYVAWSVVFGEQPSAAKWNILGTNDSSFNDGTGIFGLYKDLLAVDSNPYKFSAYRNAAQNTGNGTFAIVNLDTENFDTNSNFDLVTNVGRYTAPVAGFYSINAMANITTTNKDFLAVIYKNGAAMHYGSRGLASGTNQGSAVSALIQLAASDYIELYTYCSATAALDVGTTPSKTYMTGFLVSRT